MHQLEGGDLSHGGRRQFAVHFGPPDGGSARWHADCDLTLTGNVVSRPYLDMTVEMMRDFGAQVAWQGDHVIDVAPGGYKPRPYVIENDWSAASYWYEMVALSHDDGAEVVLPGLHRHSLQGDSQVCEVFAELGVATEFFDEPDGTEAVRLTKGGTPTGLYSRRLHSHARPGPDTDLRMHAP